MKIWRNGDTPSFTPPAHFGGLQVSNVVPFDGGPFSVQVSTAPPGAGGEMHHHETWSQVFFLMKGELTFDTGSDRFTLTEGQAVLFEPRDPHFTLNEGQNESVSLVITVDHSGRA